MTTKVVMVCSHSRKILNTTLTTIKNKLEYCLTHDYSFLLDCQEYSDAVSQVNKLICLFDKYDLIWCLDMDTIITNMTYKIDQLDCLGDDVTVCAERAFAINCGSMVFKNTENTRWLLNTIVEHKHEWEKMGLIWQEWLVKNYNKVRHALTIAPLKSFNSCSLPDFYGGPEATDWSPGDFVYHACGSKEKQIPLLNEVIKYIKYE